MKIINHLHGADFGYFYYGLSIFLRTIAKFTYNNVDINIVLSKAAKEQLSDLFETCAVVIPNFAFDARIAPKQVFRKRILFLSNVIREKGILETYKAVAHLNSNQNQSEYKLDIAGVDHDNLIESGTIKLSRSVKYHGFVSGEEKIALLSSADVLILPTYYSSEALPISLIEGLMAGCFIITTDHNHLAEYFSDKNGKIVKKNSVVEIVETIRDITDKKLSEISKDNQAYFRDKFSYENYRIAILQLFSDCKKSAG